LRDVLRQMRTISSDYARLAFEECVLKAVETIKSDYERGRVLSVLLKNKQIS
jgi:hypothetical protein